MKTVVIATNNKNKVREFKYSNYLNEQKQEINKTSMEKSKNNLQFLKKSSYKDSYNNN